MRSLSHSTMVVVLLGVLPTSLLGQAPDLISFQGHLTDTLGNAVDSSNVSMTFRLYKQGSPVWTETQFVNVDEGYYQVHLGTVEPLDTVAFDRAIELGVTLDGDGLEMTPRTWLTSSPFALGMRGLYAKYSSGGPADAFNLIGGSTANAIPGSVAGGTISGGGATGANHTVLADWGTVGGGVSNTAEGYAATVAGGEAGQATGDFSTVGGGKSNTASGNYAHVGGGRANHAAGLNAMVGGGMNNTSIGFWSTTAGGFGNTSAGSSATVPGGFENGAVGDYAFAAGYRAKAVHEGSFVWNDRSITEGTDSLVSTAPNQFLIRAAGGVGIGTTSPSSPLTVNGVIESSSGGIKFPDGSLQTSAIGESANWKVTGNAGTSPATNYIGTSDTASLVIKVNDLEAGRIQPAADSADAPNIVFGHRLNAAASGVIGATISGGGRQDVDNLANTAAGDYSTVAGGAGNTAEGHFATISGGLNNVAAGNRAAVGGGIGNDAGGNWSSIGGGVRNTTSGVRSIIGGGSRNTASGDSSTVAGGAHNVADGLGASVSGGNFNTATGENAIVGGGRMNQAMNGYSLVGGGFNNIAGGAYSVIVGGEGNSSSGSYSGVGSGRSNMATGPHSTVSGGDDNTSSGDGSTVGGGFLNTASGAGAVVSGGSANEASGFLSTIPGGQDNEATATYSFAAGWNAKANHSGTFVWADSMDSAFASTGDNQFLIRARGGVGMGTNSPEAQLHVVGAGGARDLVLGACFFGQPCGWTGEYDDDGSLSSDVGSPTSDLVLIANDSVQVHIDDAGTQWAAFTITNGSDETVFSVNKYGQVYVSGALVHSSDADRKILIDRVDVENVLSKVDALPLFEWSFRGETARHVGPTSQDFRNAFHVGDSDKGIATVDADGVALGAIQGLYKLVKEQQAEIERMQEVLIRAGLE